MPRASSHTSAPTKPYDGPPPPSSQGDIKPNMIDHKPDIKTTHSPSKTRRDYSDRKPWTHEELIQLFEYDSKSGSSMGMRAWGNAVEGKTANQSYQTWKQTLSPWIKKAIAAKGGKAGRSGSSV
ncbi:hypothetical protein CI109_106925 [Kwoniella shandongensis]|uniref:Uncharacterized protein n=1 Tax=Kwoniella shandongensis TaxID=1734106 RepID=A0A5M6C7H1_9TREE|nr:uncharacterized protein CI109_000820 [Kwoniella shandongensis]KAA5530640.1 hypothetical protein CI109_000820 [Kwoniella shandongensis]